VEGCWFTYFGEHSPVQKANEPSVLGFIKEEGVNVLLRTGQVIGGAGQVLLGGAICTGGVTCAAGGGLALKGADNIQAGLRGTDSVSQQLLVEATGSEQAGTLINAGLDLGTSVGGLVRSVPKINSLGNPTRSLFVRDPANFEPAINQATRNALTIEAFSSGSTIYGALE